MLGGSRGSNKELSTHPLLQKLVPIGQIRMSNGVRQAALRAGRRELAVPRGQSTGQKQAGCDSRCIDKFMQYGANASDLPIYEHEVQVKRPVVFADSTRLQRFLQA